jgi:acetolactate synthase-1/2/3 large subunit
MDGGQLTARVLREQGVRYLFSVHGGHLYPILASLKENGIELVHVRHEQTAAYAADGWARATATPGVCAVTAGCGLTNAVTGLCLAALTNSSVVCISGQHPTSEDQYASFQEAYGSDICGSFAKYTKRVLHWSTIEVDVRQAFREALTPPQGVSLVEIPVNIVEDADEESNQRKGARSYDLAELRSQGDPRQIERAVDLLARAERPLIAGGDGLFWSDAAAELRELADLAGIPFYTRRAGQGGLSEDHPLAVRGAWKKPFTSRADVVLAVGFKFWSGEHFGQMPTWSDQATYIQMDSTPSRIGWHVGAEVPIVGDPKLVLRQLIEGIKQLGVDFRSRWESPWTKAVAEARADFERRVVKREAAFHEHMPIHPDRLMKDLVAVMDKNATVIVDSFTLSGYVSHWLKVMFPGQVIDAGPLAPVGHCIGMSIGVQLAKPSAQVVNIIGDGGIGIGGMDLETAARHKLPVMTVLWNNSSWGPSFDETVPILKGRSFPFDMLPDIRYDKVFEPMGVYGEHVARPEEIIPALERAFSSGKPSLINVIGDKRAGHPTLGASLVGSTEAKSATEENGEASPYGSRAAARGKEST